MIGNSVRFHHPVVLILLLLTFFLRIYQLDNQSLRGDEAATVLYSALPVSQLWEHSRVTDPHPPLYYLMLHPWQWLVGEHAWVMRFAGVVASTLVVATLYTLAQYTLNATYASLLAAALLAVNPLQIWLAQDIRSYPFFTLLGLLSSWVLWWALHSHQPLATSYPPIGGNTQPASHLSPLTPRSSLFAPRFFSWLLYILLTVACFYIHYYTIFLIAFQGLFVLLNIKKFWGKKWPWVASQVAIGLSIIPGLQLAYNFIGQAAGGIDTIPTPDILRLASTALLTGFTIDGVWGLGISLLLAPIWIAGSITLLRRNFTSGSFWTLFFAIPVLGVITLSINRPFFKERFLIQAHPAFELLLAVGFLALAGVTWRMSGAAIERGSELKSHVTPNTKHAPRSSLFALRSSLLTLRSSLLAVTVLLLAILLYTNVQALNNYFTNPTYAKAPPWRLYHDFVNQQARPGDVMLTNFPEAAVSYYSPNHLPFYVVPVERDRSLKFRLDQTEQIANAYQRIWFLPLLRQGFDEQGDVLNWLDRHAERVNQIFLPAYHLNLYLSPPTIDAMLIEQPTAFAHGLHLRGYQILDKRGKSRLTPLNGSEEGFLLTLEPEDKFTLSLYWLADGPTSVPYTVFTHLIAADDFNRASQDNQPVWGTYPTTTWSPGEKITDKYTLTIPSGTPAGDHRLRVGWYQSDTLERVPVLDDRGEPAEDHAILDVIIRVE